MAPLPTAVRRLHRVPLYASRISFHALRAFASRAQDRDTSEVPTLKTKKKYSDLPLARLLPDGSVAPPLAEWISDCVEPMPKVRGRALKALKVVNSDDFVDDESAKHTRRKTSVVDSEDSELNAPRKRRSTKIKAEDSIEVDSKPGRRIQVAAVDDFEESVPRKRVKKASAEQNTDDDIPPKRNFFLEDEGDSKPRNRSKKSDTVDETNEKIKPRTRTKKAPKETGADSKPRRRSKKAVADEEQDTQPRKRTKKVAGTESDNAIAAAQPKALFKEVQENLSKFPHCVLLTRVGQFYESYFDQAIEVSRLLNIKLTTRKWNKQFIPMCGFPLVHIDKHLKALVQQNQRFVAMCEEFPRYRSSGQRDFDRRVIRVITPGTLIDESFLNQYENNYLLAISAPLDVPLDNAELQQYSVGLAWIDVSTGEFFSRHSDSESLRDDIARIGPREVVLHKDFDGRHTHPIFVVLGEERNLISYIMPSNKFTFSNPESEDIASAQDVSGTYEKLVADNMTDAIDVTDEVLEPVTSRRSAVYTADEGSAITLLTAYLKANLLEHMPALSHPDQDNVGNRLYMDSHTIKALEIRENITEGGTTGSLLSVIKRTVTSSGTRLLARWLCSPSTSIPEIQARQSLVEFFCLRSYFREDLVEALTKLEDASRIVQKFLLGRGDTSDLLAVYTTVKTWSLLKLRIERERLLEAQEREENFSPYEWSSLDSLMARFSDLDELSHRIGSALEKPDIDADESDESELEEEIEDAEPAFFKWRYGPSKWVIKPEFSETLQTLHTNLRRLLREKEDLQARLQINYDAPSLGLRSSPGLGMHVHLARAKRDHHRLNKDPNFLSINTTTTTRSYIYQEWSLLGSQIFQTSMALLAAEKEAFETLRNEVNGHAASLRRNARIMDELDVTLAFANLATEMKFVKPTFSEETIYNVTHGRHPTVELGLLTTGKVFTPNSLEMNPTTRLHIITGPNMAGKSTLLRQTALIAVLAQTGSFVPADSANLGIVDKLFSRVGAKDDLFHNRSTFMVEMLETAEILRRATPRSLVIMDEVGRGTTVNDGLAIAYATVHHLVTQNRCRALFATHFHELSDMLGYSDHTSSTFESVSFLCTDVDETEAGRFAYSYRVRPGVNRDSHGLKVALLAGMPEQALYVAGNALEVLKSRKGEGLSPVQFQL